MEKLRLTKQENIVYSTQSSNTQRLRKEVPQNNMNLSLNSISINGINLPCIISNTGVKISSQSYSIFTFPSEDLEKGKFLFMF